MLFENPIFIFSLIVSIFIFVINLYVLYVRLVQKKPVSVIPLAGGFILACGAFMACRQWWALLFIFVDLSILELLYYEFVKKVNK